MRIVLCRHRVGTEQCCIVVGCRASGRRGYGGCVAELWRRYHRSRNSCTIDRQTAEICRRVVRAQQRTHRRAHDECGNGRRFAKNLHLQHCTQEHKERRGTTGIIQTEFGQSACRLHHAAAGGAQRRKGSAVAGRCNNGNCHYTVATDRGCHQKGRLRSYPHTKRIYKHAYSSQQRKRASDSQCAAVQRSGVRLRRIGVYNRSRWQQGCYT